MNENRRARLARCRVGVCAPASQPAPGGSRSSLRDESHEMTRETDLLSFSPPLNKARWVCRTSLDDSYPELSSN